MITIFSCFRAQGKERLKLVLFHFVLLLPNSQCFVPSCPPLFFCFYLYLFSAGPCPTLTSQGNLPTDCLSLWLQSSWQTGKKLLLLGTDMLSPSSTLLSTTTRESLYAAGLPRGIYLCTWEDRILENGSCGSWLLVELWEFFHPNSAQFLLNWAVLFPYLYLMIQDTMSGSPRSEPCPTLRWQLF